MDFDKSKDMFGLISIGIIVMALGLFIPWPLPLHALQFIAILIGVIVLNREYSKLISFHNSKRKDTADNN